MATFRTVRPSLGHALELARNMRPDEVLEVRASGNYSPAEAVLEALRASPIAKTALFDGRVAAMFGVAPSHVPGTGIVWLLSTAIVDCMPLLFWRNCKPELAKLFRETGLRCLENHVDARYRRSVDWILRLGAEMAVEPKPFGYAQLPFYFFRFNREDFPCANP